MLLRLMTVNYLRNIRAHLVYFLDNIMAVLTAYVFYNIRYAIGNSAGSSSLSSLIEICINHFSRLTIINNPVDVKLFSHILAIELIIMSITVFMVMISLDSVHLIQQRNKKERK